MKCVGDINIRAHSTPRRASGVSDHRRQSADGPQFLQRFLTGLVGGMAIRDFRETSFNLKGDVGLSGDARPEGIRERSADHSGGPNGSTGKNETQIKITVEIPTGSGSDTSASTEEQVKNSFWRTS